MTSHPAQRSSSAPRRDSHRHSCRRMEGPRPCDRFPSVVTGPSKSVLRRAFDTELHSGRRRGGGGRCEQGSDGGRQRKGSDGHQEPPLPRGSSWLRPEADSWLPGLPSRLPRRRCLPVASTAAVQTAPGATDTPGHSGGTAPVFHRTSLFRSLGGRPPASVAPQSSERRALPAEEVLDGAHAIALVDLRAVAAAAAEDAVAPATVAGGERVVPRSPYRRSRPLPPTRRSRAALPCRTSPPRVAVDAVAASAAMDAVAAGAAADHVVAGATRESCRCRRARRSRPSSRCRPGGRPRRFRESCSSYAAGALPAACAGTPKPGVRP